MFSVPRDRRERSGPADGVVVAKVLSGGGGYTRSSSSRTAPASPATGTSSRSGRRSRRSTAGDHSTDALPRMGGSKGSCRADSASSRSCRVSLSSSSSRLHRATSGQHLPGQAVRWPPRGSPGSGRQESHVPADTEADQDAPHGDAGNRSGEGPGRHRPPRVRGRPGQAGQRAFGVRVTISTSSSRGWRSRSLTTTRKSS